MWIASSVVLFLLLLTAIAYCRRVWRIANENAEVAESYHVLIEEIGVEVRGTEAEANVKLLMAEHEHF